ncbi:MAG: Phosphoribosylaminoimidazole-succinocarboxamide synthase [Candidatus Thorarchaeota archaeon]|nr:MAG: Phosphoribosylaminoimidazole-succinocarboxamide synthase [Candidatus Thorarchaeota archaeon]
MSVIREGKVKRVLEDPESSQHVIIEFTNFVTAGDGAKKEELEGKGRLACDITEFLLQYLSDKGIETHYVETLEGPKIRCFRAAILPVEVVCRNVAAGSFCRRYGIDRGIELSEPLVEFFLKDDKLGDPLITEEAVMRLQLVNRSDIGFMKSIALSVNHYLSELFAQQNLRLVDFKLEFGRTADGRLVVADEISGDTMRIWNKEGESLDKDLFREDSGDLLSAYVGLLDILRKTDPKIIPIRSEEVHVMVMPKEGIKNPPGEVTRKGLIRLGFQDVKEVRVGKEFKIVLTRPLTSSLLKGLELMNIKLLTNPIAETHEVRLS